MYIFSKNNEPINIGINIKERDGSYEKDEKIEEENHMDIYANRN
jgi:hypothetical protein